MNTDVTNNQYIPENFYRKAQRKNDMVYKRIQQYTPLIGGSTVLQGGHIEADIQSQQPHALNSISLVGDLYLSGYLTANPVKFHGGATDLVNSISVDINSYKMVDISTKAGLVAYAHRNSNRTQERFESDKVKLLSDKELVADGKTYPIKIDFKDFGLNCEYLMTTGLGSKQHIEINLNNNIKEIFGREGSAGGNAVTLQYELRNAFILCEYYELSPAADTLIRNSLNSQTGLSYPLFSYWITDFTLPVATTQSHLVPESFLNVVSNYVLPMSGGYGANTTNGNTAGTVGYANLLKWNANGTSIPNKFVAGFVGDEPRNIGGSSGQSGRALGLQSLINCSKHNVNDEVHGYGWAKDYATADTYGPLGVCFLRGTEKDAAITDCGVNGFLSNGQMKIDYNLETGPALGSKLYVIVEFTRLLTINSQGITERK